MLVQKTKVAKWGNSVAVRIPDSVVRCAQLIPGHEVMVSLKGEKVIIEKPASPPVTLEKLVSKITKKNRHGYAWKGVKAVGAEVWDA